MGVGRSTVMSSNEELCVDTGVIVSGGCNREVLKTIRKDIESLRGTPCGAHHQDDGGKLSLAEPFSVNIGCERKTVLGF